MATEVTSASRTIGVNDRWLYKVGGVSALVVAVIFIVDLVLYSIAGKMPSLGAAWLPYINGKSGAWEAIVSVGVVSDLGLLVLNLSLYTALRPLNRALTLIALAWAALSVVFNETIINLPTNSLIALARSYATAGTAAQRTAEAAAADAAVATITSRMDMIFISVVPSVAVILFSIVMMRSNFGKRIAYLGFAASTFGIISAAGWDLAVLINTILQVIWLVLVARILYFRYAASTSVVPAAGTEARAAEAATPEAETSEEAVRI
jgi:hypothetical protein